MEIRPQQSIKTFVRVGKVEENKARRRSQMHQGKEQLYNLCFGIMEKRKLIEPIYIKELVENLASIEDIAIKSKKRPLTVYRFIYCQLCKDFKQYIANYSLELVGKFIKRDHATVLNAHKKFEYDNLKNNRIYIKAVLLLSRQIDAHPPEKIKKEDLLHFYRLKHIELSDKYRSVIKSLSNKLEMYRTNDLVHAIAALQGDELKEAEIKFDAFLKVVKSRKMQKQSS